MDAAVARAASDHLIGQGISSRVRIPQDPSPGEYIVIDVTHFSTTVAELLANGAEYVHGDRRAG